MAHEFRKLDTNSTFPNIDNVEVYKYDNDFNYTRYDYTQMDLQICSVPWDMGEAHIGNRTISGIGNVVYFGSKEKRDAWFDAIPDSQCFRFSTKFKELHREQVIDVPIPYDVCARFNYLKVHYALFANDDSPVMFEDDDGLRDWFWFIREVEFVAPNTTRLHLMDDAFQTWIYDVDITGMVLERGHAPMFEVNADEYLADPLDNNELLLTEDVNFGEISQVKHIDALALNAGTMYACIATSANPNLDWGSKAGDDWNTPASESYTANGNPSFYVFAIPATQLATLLYNITQLCPQFKQTVQGVFFASADLVTLGSPFTFADTTCYNVSSTRRTLEFVQLEKSQFGYPSRYANLAKLYTSPYAHIEITDENGNVDIVRIEDTTGTLDVSAALSLAYPFVTIDAHILGAGGSASATVTFRNVSAHTFDVSGQWYETLRTWNVPTFAVVLDAATEYDYSTHFDRIQRENDYNKAYANASASADTAKTNRDASALTARDNAYRSADTALSNANASADTAKANADASALTARDNAYAATDTAKANAHASADTAKANADLSATTARDNAYAGADTARDNAHAMADTVKANADASALAAKDNAYDSAATAKANVATIAAANKANTDDSADAAATNVATIAAANKANAYDSATTAKTNTATIAAANKANADDNADTLVDNAALNTAANTATTTRSNQSASTDSSNAQSFNTAITTADNLIVSFSATSTIAANEQQGAISAGASMANGIIGAAGSAASLDPIGAVSSIASGIVGGATTIASTAVANGLTAAQANYTQAGNSAHETASNTKTSLDTTNHNNTATDLTATQNTLITGTTANSAATTKGNATRTQTAENTAATATETTTKANALRTQTAENTAAALTQTTTKANATRTQTAENTAATATETTTKGNAYRTYNTATGNNADMQTTTKANATRTRTTDRSNALNTYNTAITNNAATNTTAKDNATHDNTTDRANALRTYNTAIANNAAANTTAKANAVRSNTAERANALDTYSTATANNLRDYNTAIANATRDKENAQADIENDILQAALRSPFVYGEFANGESSANKPIALFANIVTQSKGAISAAGDEFLRYGYALDKFWEFDGEWCIGKYFTYWKLRDFWVSNLNVPDMYMDRLRFFLFGGVTIWRRPEDIGKRNIYENFA